MKHVFDCNALLCKEVWQSHPEQNDGLYSAGARALKALKIKTCTRTMQAQETVLTSPWHKQMARCLE